MPVIGIVDLAERLPYTSMIIHERILQPQHGAIIAMVRLSNCDLTWKSMKMAERLGSALARIWKRGSQAKTREETNNKTCNDLANLSTQNS